ncbi:hypothetical protein ABPG73_008783 [Tetrahymena malaccensis]
MKYYKKIIIFFGLVSLSLQNGCAEYATWTTKCTCFDGYYSPDPSNIPCQQCPPGTTTYLGNNQYGDVSMCAKCQGGYYQTAQAIQGSPASCIACPTGTTFIIEGRRRFLSFTAQTEDVCDTCKIGYYKKQNSSYQKAAICIQCPSNSAFLSGPVNGQTATDCNGCIQGYYVSQTANSNSPATCSPCPNQALASYATYLQTIDSCNQCFAGYYSTTPSNTQANCKQCPANTTTQKNGVNDITKCNVCKFNSYMTQQATQSNSAICQSCPTGSGNYVINAQLGDASNCNICLEGYYMTQLAVKGAQPTAAACSQCPPNSTSFVSLSLQLNCADYASYINSKCRCFDGYFSSDASKVPCQKCPLGTTNSQSFNSDGDVSQCSMCQSDYYQTAQAIPGSPATCIACPKGSIHYNSNSARMRFLSFTPQDESACNYCQTGYYLKDYSSQGKAVTCIQSPSNTFTSDGGNIQQTVANCNLCIQGYYLTLAVQNGQSAACSPCPQYSYADYKITQQTTNDCNKCIQGYYSTSPSNTQANCKQCPQNTTTNGSDANSLSSCSVCQINSYMTQQETQSNSAICQSCPTGSGNYVLNAQLGDASNCNICLEGYYMTQLAVKGAQPTAAACSQCPPNSTSKSTSIINSISSCICYDSQALQISPSTPGYGAYSYGKKQTYSISLFLLVILTFLILFV